MVPQCAYGTGSVVEKIALQKGDIAVEDLGIILSSRQQRPPRPDKDYFVRAFFPNHPTSPSNLTS